MYNDKYKTNKEKRVLRKATEAIIKMAKENNGTVATAMVGLDTRAIMDMDATIKRMPVNYPTMAVPLKLDINMGNKITPPKSHIVSYFFWKIEGSLCLLTI